MNISIHLSLSIYLSSIYLYPTYTTFLLLQFFTLDSIYNSTLLNFLVLIYTKQAVDKKKEKKWKVKFKYLTIFPSNHFYLLHTHKKYRNRSIHLHYFSCLHKISLQAQPCIPIHS